MTQYNGDQVTGIMAIKLSIPGMSGTIRDKEAEGIIANQANSDPEEIRATKKLFGKEFWTEVSTLASQIRTLYYKATNPWDDKGWRVIGAENWTNFKGEFDMLSQKLELAVMKKLPEIAEHKLARQSVLGTLYKESDYPSEDAIQKKWTPTLDIEPIAKPKDLYKDLRFRIAHNEVATIKQECQKRFDGKINGAMDHAWKLAFNTVEHILQRTQAKHEDSSAMFHDSVIENAQQVAEFLPGLNIAGDVRMNDIAKAIKEKLNVPPEDIKKFPIIRQELINNAKSILSEIDSYMKGPDHASSTTNQPSAPNTINSVGRSNQDSGTQNSQSQANDHSKGSFLGYLHSHDAVEAA